MKLIGESNRLNKISCELVGKFNIKISKILGFSEFCITLEKIKNIQQKYEHHKNRILQSISKNTVTK